MAYNVQQQVDAYETMGLGALQNMQQKNPKLLVGIALENLQKDMQEQQRAKQMASGAVGPTVIDKKLMGLAGAGVGLGQQQAMATAAPGLQMRGRQMQAAQMRKAMAPQAQPMRMASGGVVGYAPGGRVTADDIDMEDLLTALMVAESGGDPRAVSAAGAEGAYQIMPSTAEDPGFGVSPMEGSRFDPEASRKFARDYLQAMIDRYDGDIEAALIAYNAGAGNADKFIAAGRDYDALPQAMQTQPYVDKIMSQLDRGVQEPSPGFIASRQTARKARDFLGGVGDFVSGLFDETEATRERRREQEEFNRLVRARNEAIRTGENPRAAIESVRADMEDEQEAERRAAMEGFTPEEEAAGGMGYLQYLARRQREDQERKDREARAAAGYLRTMQNQEDMISRANPATNLSGVDLRQDFSTERSMKSPAQRFEEAFPGSREAAGRYAMDKAAGLAALSDRAPEAVRSNNPLVNLRSDLGEIGSYLQRVLGFQEGGQIKNFQEGDLVEADGEQVIPLSSVTDDPGVIQRVTDFLKDNKQEIALGAGLALTFVPYVGPAIKGLQMGRAGLTAGLAALRNAPQALRSAQPFLSGQATRPASQSRLGRIAEKVYSRPRTSGSGSGARGPTGQQRSVQQAREEGLRLNREFAPGRISQLAGAGILAAAARGGDDEVEAAPRDTSNLPRNRPFDVEAFSEAFPELAEEMRRRPQTDYDQQLAEVRERARQNQRQDSRGGGQGIASRLGSALTSDKAQQLYSAFQDLGLAGGASRGFEGAQLTSALTQRDLAQQEAEARQRALDIDEQTLQLTSDMARQDFMAELYNSQAFYDISQEIADQMGKPRSDPEVVQEALRILLGSMAPDNLSAADSIVGI